MANSASSKPTNEAKQNKKQHHRRKKASKAEQKHAAILNTQSQTQPLSELSESEYTIVVEYVAASAPSLDPSLSEFSTVFSRFGERAQEAYNNITATTEDSEEKAKIDDEDDYMTQDLIHSKNAGGGDDDEDDENAEAKALASKKKKKLEQRLSIAQLKQTVSKPDVVEWVDITAANPTLLVHLKSTRNTVPIPIHWQQKRKYLQGKRGIEKPPFDLPDFIKQTGIMDMRQAVKEKEDSAKLKSKLRERVQPKMGKLDIDYQKLHDAFFRWQTKPKLSGHGDMYYEGKEYETKLKFQKPGVLSTELQEALGMNNDPTIAPPWLINMQRYGPPPSYPGLKIPGLNCPIPPGAMWGYQAGGWGKPPVDEFGRPLYGDVFGVLGSNGSSGENGNGYVAQEYIAPIERTVWGELEPEEEVPEVEEEEQEEEEEDDASSAAPEEPGSSMSSGLVTPSGLASVPSGLETPDFIELRKDTRRDDGVPKELYKIIPQKETAIRGFMGSQHAYDLSAASFAPPPPSSGITSTNASASKRKLPPGLISDRPVAMSLNPEDLEDGLAGDAVKRAYEEKMKVARKEAAGEDFSDLVAEHAGKMANKKRRKDADEKGRSGKGGKDENSMEELKYLTKTKLKRSVQDALGGQN